MLTDASGYDAGGQRPEHNGYTGSGYEKGSTMQGAGDMNGGNGSDISGNTPLAQVIGVASPPPLPPTVKVTATAPVTTTTTAIDSDGTITVTMTNSTTITTTTTYQDGTTTISQTVNTITGTATSTGTVTSSISTTTSTPTTTPPPGIDWGEFGGAVLKTGVGTLCATGNLVAAAGGAVTGGLIDAGKQFGHALGLW